MSSLKQTIVDAVHRVTTDPKYSDRQYESNAAARDDFVKALIAELFPESPDMPAPKKEEVELPVLEEAMATMTLEEPKPKEKKKPGPKPKAKPEGPVNLEKLNPTQSKKLKAAGLEVSVEPDKKAFIAYLNGLTTEEFDAKKFEDHIKDFLAPKPKEEVKTAKVMTMYTEFEGETYYVDLKTKRVYQQEGAVDVYVGDVGLAKFKDMEMPA